MAINFDTIQDLGLSRSVVDETKSKSLGQDEFLMLMTTQMTHQDPTKPMENGDFLAQMAQFGTVEGINDLKDSFAAFASSMTSNQALDAAYLLGRSVEFPGDSAMLELSKPLSGSIELESAASQVTVNIVASNGEVVKTLNLGVQSAGGVKFEWDGLMDDGNYAAPGLYKIDAQGLIGGTNTSLATFVNATVQSVDLGGAQKGIQLDLGQSGKIDFNKVKQIS
jgi:flagellar basal-body rod modification protein FlgD